MTHGVLSDTKYDGVASVGNGKEQPSSVRMARPEEVEKLQSKPSREMVIEATRNLGWLHWLNLFQEMNQQRNA